MASLMLSLSTRGNRKMKSKRNLMTALVGLAMLATPITAAAKDHNHDAANTSHPSHSSSFHTSTAPARNFSAARVGNVNEYRAQGAAHRDWVDNHRGWTPGYGYGHPGYYANRGYYNPGYVAPVAPYYAPGYAGYGGGAGSCAKARQIQTVYQQDRYRGHPAAAADVLRQ